MDRTEHLSAAARMAELEMEIARQSRRQNYFAALASECNARFARQAEIIKKLEATSAERDLMIARLREENALLLAQRDQIRNSLSWRITMPLRVLSRAVRKSVKGLRDARNGTKF
jgi:hypothetical protein